MPSISKIQSGHSVILASSFGQTLPSVLKPENSHLSDGPLVIWSLQLLLLGIKHIFLMPNKSNCRLQITNGPSDK